MLGFALLLIDVEWYGPGYPAWRHATMATIDLGIALTATFRPSWLLVVLPVFIAERLLFHGFGWTPVAAALGFFLFLWERHRGKLQ